MVLVQVKLQDAGKVRELISGAGLENSVTTISFWEDDNNNYNINTILFIEVWCNGSTSDFGSDSSSSNLDTSTTVVSNVFIEYSKVIICDEG